MINVAEIVNDSDFAQQYTVYRKTGEWDRGSYITTESAISFYGTVTVATPHDIVQTAEGDRIQGDMCFYSTQEIFKTREQGTSDEIVWNGDRYRIYSVAPWKDYGYYKSIGCRMKGN